MNNIELSLAAAREALATLRRAQIAVDAALEALETAQGNA